MYNGIDPDRIQAAREYAAGYERRLIDGILSGEVKANDPDKWIDQLEGSIDRILSGLEDANFTIWQRMNYFLTGECIPFLQ